MVAISASAEAAFKSAHPEVLAVYRAKLEEHNEYTKKVNAQLVAWGFPYGHDRLTKRHTMHSRPYTLMGVAPLEGQDPPPGWRVEKHSGAWVPKMTTNAGKKIAAELDDVQPPVKLTEVLPGMEPFSMHGNRIWAPAMFVCDETMYLHWGARPDRVDTTIWTEIKISEWYLAKEKHEDGKSADEYSSSTVV